VWDVEGENMRPGKMTQNEKAVNDKWKAGEFWRASDMG